MLVTPQSLTNNVSDERPLVANKRFTQPNRITAESRQLVSQLVHDPAYQRRLREDFRRRKVHPTIEALIWNHHLGKPKQTLDLTATVEVNARLEEEKRVFATLDVADLEQLAAESQALVDRALTLSRARIAAAPIPQSIVGESERMSAARKST